MDEELLGSCTPDMMSIEDRQLLALAVALFRAACKTFEVSMFLDVLGSYVTSFYHPHLFFWS